MPRHSTPVVVGDMVVASTRPTSSRGPNAPSEQLGRDTSRLLGECARKKRVCAGGTALLRCGRRPVSRPINKQEPYPIPAPLVGYVGGPRWVDIYEAGKPRGIQPGTGPCVRGPCVQLGSLAVCTLFACRETEEDEDWSAMPGRARGEGWVGVCGIGAEEGGGMAPLL